MGAILAMLEHINPTWIVVAFVVLGALWNLIIIPQVHRNLQGEIDKRWRAWEEAVKDLEFKISMAQKRADDAHSAHADQQNMHSAYRERIAAIMVTRDVIDDLDKRFMTHLHNAENRINDSVKGVSDRIDTFTKLVVEGIRKTN